jgi:hypothetical protein
MSFSALSLAYLMAGASSVAMAQVPAVQIERPTELRLSALDLDQGISQPSGGAAARPDVRSDGSDAAEDAQIVVTGSRVVTDGTRAPTPLTVATTEALAANAPGSIADGLNQLPVFQGAINAQTSQLVSSNRVRSGNYLNLRNLGPQRVLVLQDGLSPAAERQ